MHSKRCALFSMAVCGLTAVGFLICGTTQGTVTDLMFGAHAAILIGLWAVAQAMNTISVVKNDGIDKWWDGVVGCAVAGYFFIYLTAPELRDYYKFYLLEKDFGQITSYGISLFTILFSIILTFLKEHLHPSTDAKKDDKEIQENRQPKELSAH